eukprot:2085118-Prymnesium_polylepis.1
MGSHISLTQRLTRKQPAHGRAHAASLFAADRCGACHRTIRRGSAAKDAAAAGVLGSQLDSVRSDV